MAIFNIIRSSASQRRRRRTFHKSQIFMVAANNKTANRRPQKNQLQTLTLTSRSQTGYSTSTSRKSPAPRNSKTLMASRSRTHVPKQVPKQVPPPWSKKFLPRNPNPDPRRYPFHPLSLCQVAKKDHSKPRKVI
jgi:hypothetical protein